MPGALIIFIKNPIAGQVKTRLAKTVGDVPALQIYKELLRHTRQTCLKVDADRYVYYSNFIDDEDEWLPQSFNKRLQKGADLGERMQAAFAEVLEHHSCAIIIGSDCASLDENILQTALEKLEDAPFVIGPAKDGGYYLLGMRQFTPELFEGINWSTEEVLPETLRRMKLSDGEPFHLPVLSDIDTEDDWKEYLIFSG